jgi:predicted MPP superfamily phosphohydrolase
MSITLLIILILYIFGFLNVRSIQIVNLEITSDLPPQNRELHIVLVSDTHFGYLITKSKFQNWVKLINSQNPDIIIFAGDISDHFIDPVIHQNLHEEFNELISKYGIFAVTGNHEFMSSPRDGLEQYLKKKTHVKYLRDSSELIDNSFYVIGRDDRSNRQRLTLRALAKDFNRTKPVIVIDHQPMDLQESVENGITVTLCGHTHAGQFFPATVAVKFVFDLSYGYGKRGNSHFYVSSGLGVWGPQCRIGSKSEIVKIKLSY